jgi:hypothetical protein
MHKEEVPVLNNVESKNLRLTSDLHTLVLTHRNVHVHLQVSTHLHTHTHAIHIPKQRSKLFIFKQSRALSEREERRGCCSQESFIPHHVTKLDEYLRNRNFFFNYINKIIYSYLCRAND